MYIDSKQRYFLIFCSTRHDGNKNVTCFFYFIDKPIFSPLDPYELTGLEGEPFVISVSARGNPNTTEYTWTRDGLPLSNSGKRITAHGPTLNITRLNRHDAGTYICEALNKEGTTFYQLNLTVQCK